MSYLMATAIPNLFKFLLTRMNLHNYNNTKVVMDYRACTIMTIGSLRQLQILWKIKIRVIIFTKYDITNVYEEVMV